MLELSASDLMPEDAGTPQPVHAVDHAAPTVAPDQGAKHDEVAGSLEVDSFDDEPFAGEPTRIESDGAPLAEQDIGPSLLVIGGNSRGQTFVLKPGDNSIGRGLDNDVVLADIAVSRKHTLICKEGPRFVLRDLGSGNGTLVNGQRVSSHPLRDGDQIELGNTMLRFCYPEAAAAAVAASSGPSAHPSINATMDVRQAPVVPQPAKQSRDKRSSTRVRRLLLFGGGALIALFGLMIGIKLALDKRAAPAKKKRPRINASELAAKHFEEGRKQFTARNWKQARKHYLRVYALAPGFEEAKRYADQALAELKASQALERAKRALDEKVYDTARSELAKIPSNSTYADRTRKLKQRVDDEQVAALVAAAKRLSADGDKEGATGKLKQARSIQPTNQVVKDLYAAVSGDGGERTAVRRRHERSPARRSAPRAGSSRRRHRASRREHEDRDVRRRHGSIRVSGAGVREALRQYGKKQWGVAYKALKDQAGKLSGRRKAKVDALAEAVRKVGQYYRRAQASRTRNPKAALAAYKKALAADATIGRGPHQQMIKKEAFKTARVYATTSLAGKRYAEANHALRVAKRYGSVDSTLQRVQATLEKKAMQLFTRGYTMRSSNLDGARRLWQRVLRMVPPSSKAYQKAYSWLNSSAPKYHDEDEE